MDDEIKNKRNSKEFIINILPCIAIKITIPKKNTQPNSVVRVTLDDNQATK